MSQYAPPSSLVAARRVAAIAKYLGRAGYPVTVLTSSSSGTGPIEGAESVVRTRDALTSPLNWRRRHFAALAGGTGESYKPPSRLASVVVPDLSLLTWLPFALPAAVRLSRAGGFDCVLTTSPPPSVHLVGRALRRRGIPWIAELRDGWTFEPPHPPWPLQAQRGLDRGLERRVLSQADAVIGVTSPIVEDVRARLGLDAELITNGYDPEDVPPDPAEPDPLLSPDRHSLVHTGRLSLSGVSLERVLDGVRIAREDPAAHRLERLCGLAVRGGAPSARRTRSRGRRSLRRLARAAACARSSAGGGHPPRGHRGSRAAQRGDRQTVRVPLCRAADPRGG